MNKVDKVISEAEKLIGSFQITLIALREIKLIPLKTNEEMAHISAEAINDIRELVK